jgi:3-isopropylmalate/(R)-2-methylmalate dehydratase small subunit
MEAFKTFKSVAVPIDIPNCDTDQIIPARLLRHDSDTPGYDRFLFHDLRFDDAGNETDFIFNKEPYREGKILVADINWGCGSSREGAVSVLVANGIRSVIAPSFGDIHYNNCLKNGVLPIRLSREDCDTIRAHLHEAPGVEIDIDLEKQTVTTLNGTTFKFDIGTFDKECLMNGVDDIGLTQSHDADIAKFEADRPEYAWL